MSKFLVQVRPGNLDKSICKRKIKFVQVPCPSSCPSSGSYPGGEFSYPNIFFFWLSAGRTWTSDSSRGKHVIKLVSKFGAWKHFCWDTYTVLSNNGTWTSTWTTAGLLQALSVCPDSRARRRLILVRPTRLILVRPTRLLKERQVMRGRRPGLGLVPDGSGGEVILFLSTGSPNAFGRFVYFFKVLIWIFSSTGSPNGSGRFHFFSSTGLPNGPGGVWLSTASPNGSGGRLDFFQVLVRPTGLGVSFFFKYWSAQRARRGLA